MKKKYEVSYKKKDGTKVNGQIYTAEWIAKVLADLEAWGATEIVIKSIEQPNA